MKPTGALDETGQKLLGLIRDASDEDGPRLVFADHIADQFPEHARLIVAQCQSDKADPRFIDDLIGTLPTYFADWAPPERGFYGFPWNADEHVGFEHEVNVIPAASFTSDQYTIERVAPFFTKVALSHASERVVEICGEPVVRQLCRFAFRDTRLTPGDVEAIAWSPHLAHLKELDLRGTELTAGALIPLFETDIIRELTCLRIEAVPSRERRPTLQHLPGAGFAGSLRRLVVAGVDHGDEVVDAVAGLPRLDELELDDVRISNQGLARLAALPHRFRSLRVCGSPWFGTPGVLLLARSPILSRLQDLYLKAALDEEAFLALIDSPHLRELRTLTLGGTPTDRSGIQTPAIRALATSKILDVVTWLDLSDNAIRSHAALLLSRCDLPRLRTLKLRNNHVADEGAASLAAAPFLKNLRHLDLSDNGLTDAAAFAFARASERPRHLTLRGARLSYAAQTALEGRFGDAVTF